jgi:hypothetical protein
MGRPPLYCWVCYRARCAPACSLRTPPPPPPPRTDAAPGSGTGTCASPTVAEPTPSNRWVSIQKATCERLLELSPDDRAAASLFYIGYHVARFRSRAINVGAIPDAEAWADNYCVKHPGRPAVEAFRQAYRQTLRR